MNRNTGHVIRMTGLVIEMLGVWGVYRSQGVADQARFTLPGGSVVPLPWLAVGVGFVLWVVGTIIVTMTRRRRKSLSLDE